MTHVAVVLAAGKSTRMRSRTPKVAHSMLGRPLLAHVLFAAHAALRGHAADEGNHPSNVTEDDSSHLVVVLGHEAERVIAALQATAGLPAYRIVRQTEPLGTGDAVRAAQRLLEGDGELHPPSSILVLYGDSPLVRPETLSELLSTHERSGATLTFLTGHATTNTGYGRIIRDTAGKVLGIVEERHCSPEQLLIGEVNSGIYCFNPHWLWSRLSRLEPHASGEFYLTDLVDLAASEGTRVETLSAALSETAGVNDRIQLSEATTILRRRVLDDLMRSGVTIVDPATTYVESTVQIGMDTTILPFTTLHGSTVIGEDCVVGPYSSLHDSVIGDRCRIAGSWLEGATMDADSHIGPMGHLRPGAHLESGVFLGNFGEVKNATLGRNVKMHHFGFIGDAAVGADTNIGAGVITVNYDGRAKHHTQVGDGAFLGCDTLLIAPVTVGNDAITGAGAVVTRGVPDGGVAVGVPARVIRHTRSRNASHANAGEGTSSTEAPHNASPSSSESPNTSGQRTRAQSVDAEDVGEEHVADG